MTLLYSPYILWLSPGTGTTEMEDTGRPVWDETLRCARSTGAKTEQGETASCLEAKLSCTHWWQKAGGAPPKNRLSLSSSSSSSSSLAAGDESRTCATDWCCLHDFPTFYKYAQYSKENQQSILKSFFPHYNYNYTVMYTGEENRCIYAKRAPRGL